MTRRNGIAMLIGNAPPYGMVWILPWGYWALQPRTIEGYGVWIRTQRPPERGRLGPGCSRAYRGAGRGRGRGRAAGPAPGRDQGQLLLALPVQGGAAGGGAGALGAGRTGRSVRPARGHPGSRPTPALAVRPGRARGALAHHLQRAAQGPGPSGGAAGDRARVRAPPGVPHRF